MRRRGIASALGAVAWGLAVMTTPGVALAAEHRLTLRPTPAGLDAAEIELWIPESLAAERPVRGVIGSSKYHAGAGVYDEEQWRDLARRQDMAILRYLVTSRGKPIDTSEAGAHAILAALRELAREAGRPELEFSCIIPTGLSWAANQVCMFTSYIPERVIAAVPFRATARDLTRAAAAPASRAVPLLHMSAGREHFGGYRPHESEKAFDTLPAEGALYAMLVQPGEEHHVLGDLSFVMIWLEEVIDLRLPDEIPQGRPLALRPVNEGTGWSGRFAVRTGVNENPWRGGDAMVDSSVVPYAAHPGSRPPGGRTWLPSERLARAWLSYANTGGTGPVETYVPRRVAAERDRKRKAEAFKAGPAKPEAAAIRPEKLDPWRRRLAALVVESVAAGRSEKLALRLGRQTTRGNVAGADEAALHFAAPGGLRMALGWERLGLDDCEALARAYRRKDDAESALLAAVFAMANGNGAEAEDAFAAATRVLGDGGAGAAKAKASLR